MSTAKHLSYATKQAKMDLEDDGYTVVPAPTGYPWNLVAVKENSTLPVLCVQVKWTKTPKGAQILKTKYQKPYLPSGIQPYQHALWIWIDRKGWFEDLTNSPQK